MRRVELNGVCGWLHVPDGAVHGAIGLTHGAGSNCEAPLLVSVADEFARHGFAVLRYDLPFRQARPKGAPTGAQAKDRDGIRAAAKVLADLAPDVPHYLGGHSYGGRQTSMVAAEDPQLAKALLLLGYPLHPPKQPEKPRTEHFPALRTPAYFVHGAKDEFATVAELEAARLLIPAHTKIDHIEKGKHGLDPKLARQIVEGFVTFTKE